MANKPTAAQLAVLRTLSLTGRVWFRELNYGSHLRCMKLYLPRSIEQGSEDRDVTGVIATLKRNRRIKLRGPFQHTTWQGIGWRAVEITPDGLACL